MDARDETKVPDHLRIGHRPNDDHRAVRKTLGHLGHRPYVQAAVYGAGVENLRPRERPQPVRRPPRLLPFGGRYAIWDDDARPKRIEPSKQMLRHRAHAMPARPDRLIGMNIVRPPFAMVAK